MPDAKPLTLDQLQKAVTGTDAAIRCVAKLQPAGGQGDKVFPPTYAGATYAWEKRLTANGDGTTREVQCVLIDAVQSQANRMEEALLDAYEDERIKLPMLAVDFSLTQAGKDQTDREVRREGRLTALEAPHRISDAVFRDSVTEKGIAFRESPEGKAFEEANIRDATAIFGLCPTALLFGTWDSTGSRGGLGNKFARALVSEIIGFDAVMGVRTSSRLDPLGIEKCDLYVAEDGGWTVDPNEARKDKKGEPEKYATNSGKGNPSAINHGNVTPDIAKGDDGEPRAGGVTIAYAKQFTTLSLGQLRRLRFPDSAGKRSQERNTAARTVLLALGVTAVTLLRERSCDLRSRCLLVAEDEPRFELVPNVGKPQPFVLKADDAIALFYKAVERAKEVGLPWREEPFILRPSDRLVELVKKGRAAAAESEGGNG